MKIFRKFVLIFWGLIIFSPVKASQWPGVEFDGVKVYVYNTKNDLRASHAIVQDGVVSNTIANAGVFLSQKEIQEVLKLANSKIFSQIHRLSKTYLPHHAFVFYKKNKPVAFITFDFNGEGINFMPEIALPSTFEAYTEKQMTDFSEKLDGFKTIFKNRMFPLFSSPFQYENILEEKCDELVLKQNGIRQLFDFKGKRFDLSGIFAYENKTYCVADKFENRFVYEIDTNENKISIVDKIPVEIPVDQKIDFEGVAVTDSAIWLANEENNTIVSISRQTKTTSVITLPWERVNERVETWGNRGLEGIAADEHNIWLAKERQPRRLFKYDLESMNLISVFDDYISKENYRYDISDLFYLDKYLYLLQRNSSKIIRINILNGMVREVSFVKTSFNNGQRLYDNDHSEYGMAEALFITDKEIWIGLDNNGDKVSEWGKKLGLKKGKAPVILVFERPDGF